MKESQKEIIIEALKNYRNKLTSDLETLNKNQERYEKKAYNTMYNEKLDKISEIELILPFFK